MQKRNLLYLSILAAIIFCFSYAHAAIQFLPRYQGSYEGRVEDGGRDKVEVSCEVFGGVEKKEKQTCSGLFKLRNLTCYKECHCDSSIYQYSILQHQGSGKLCASLSDPCTDKNGTLYASCVFNTCKAQNSEWIEDKERTIYTEENYECNKQAFSSAEGDCYQCSCPESWAEGNCPSNSVDCEICKAISPYKISKYKLNSCKEGYYKEDSKCLECPAGSYCDGISKKNCPAGSYSERNATTCKSCSAGTYSNEGASSCTSCPAGKYSKAGAGYCNICSAGTYSNSGASSCISCPAGKYSNAGAGYCNICPAGKYSKAGASYCNICSAGTYSNSGASSCTTCASGSYSSSGASSCLKCPEGQTSNSEHTDCITATCSSILKGLGYTPISGQADADYISNNRINGPYVLVDDFYGDITFNDGSLYTLGTLDGTPDGASDLCANSYPIITGGKVSFGYSPWEPTYIYPDIYTDQLSLAEYADYIFYGTVQVYDIIRLGTGSLIFDGRDITVNDIYADSLSLKGDGQIDFSGGFYPPYESAYIFMDPNTCIYSGNDFGFRICADTETYVSYDFLDWSDYTVIENATGEFFMPYQCDESSYKSNDGKAWIKCKGKISHNCPSGTFPGVRNVKSCSGTELYTTANRGYTWCPFGYGQFCHNPDTSVEAPGYPGCYKCLEVTACQDDYEQCMKNAGDNLSWCERTANDSYGRCLSSASSNTDETVDWSAYCTEINNADLDQCYSNYESEMYDCESEYQECLSKSSEIATEIVCKKCV